MSGPLHAGECGRCGDYGHLNADGLCHKCGGRPPCHHHPDRGAVGRCKGCKQTFCRACMPQRHCKACAEALPAPKLAPSPDAVAPSLPVATQDQGKSTRSWAILVAFWLVLGGGNWAWYQWQESLWERSNAPESQKLEQKLSQVREVVSAFKRSQGRWPKNAEEVQRHAQSLGLRRVRPVGDPTQAKAGDVVFRPKGQGFEVFAVDAQGKAFRRPPQRHSGS